MQELNTNYRRIPLKKSDLPALVDERDYERVSKYKWRLAPPNHGKSYAVRTGERGKVVYLHQQIMNWHANNHYNSITHNNGDTLDNRFFNLRAKYATSDRSSHFCLSEPLANEVRGNDLVQRYSNFVNVINTDGVVIRSNLLDLIEAFQKEIDSLLCQRLIAVQLIAASRDNLASIQKQLANTLFQVEESIAFLDRTIKEMQPKEILPK